MLVAQAVKSAGIFLDKNIDESITEKIITAIKAKALNILLIGMPGCGKTTAGKALSEMTGRNFTDTDILCREISGRTPEEIIRSDGEAAFRKIETRALSLCSKKSGGIIAVGGGAPIIEENRYLLQQNSVVIYLKRDVTSLETKGRPLSQGSGALEKLYEMRAPVYESLSDVCVETDDSSLVTAKKILEAFNNEISRD